MILLLLFAKISKMSRDGIDVFQMMTDWNFVHGLPGQNLGF